MVNGPYINDLAGIELLCQKLAQRHQKVTNTHDLHRNKQTDNLIEVDGGN